MEKPSMAGRFVCVAAYPSMKEYVEFFRNAHPDIAMIKEVEADYPRVEGRSRKLVDAGFSYKYGLDEILEDSYRCAKKLRLIN